MKRISILVQARMSSTRLPGKVLLPLGKKTVLAHLLDRLNYVKNANHKAVVLPSAPQNDILAQFLETNYPQVEYFRGSEEDVLSRYFEAAKLFGSDIIIRLTSDCPLIDPAIIDAAIDLFLSTPNCSYVSNSIHKTFPRGMDVEVFSFEALQEAFTKATDSAEREHVTLYLYRRPEIFRLASLVSSQDLSSLRLTVDEPQDLMTVREVYERLASTGPVSSLQDIQTLYENRPELFTLNSRVQQKPVFIKHETKEALKNIPQTTFMPE